MELAQATYDLGHGEPVRRTQVLDHLGRENTGGTTTRFVSSTVTGYGLISTSSDGKRFQPTPLGIALLNATTDSERAHRAWDVLQTNPIFVAFVKRWEDQSLPPNEQVLIDWLAEQHDLPENDARACFRIVMRNLTDYDLVRKSSAGKVTRFESPEMKYGLLDAPSFSQANDASPADDTLPAPVEDVPVLPAMTSALQAAAPHLPVPAAAPATLVGQLQPQFVFNIQVQLPDSADPTTYDAIFRSMAVHLLGRAEE